MAKAKKETVEEYGLGLPNGTISWGSYSGHFFATTEQRRQMVEVLRQTAQQCGFAQEEFLQRYNWNRRLVTTTVRYDTGTSPVDSAVVIGRHDDNNNDSDEGNVVTPGNDTGDSGAVRSGPVGGDAV